MTGSGFTIALQDENFDPYQIAPDLVAEVQSYSASRIGGYKDAEIVLSGSDDSLIDAAGWLRFGIHILNRLGSIVWSGYVHAVELEIGGVKGGLSLAGMSNAVKVTYTYQDANGNTVRGSSDWSTDAQSISRHGRKEKILSKNNLTSAAADSQRDFYLNSNKSPRGVPSLDMSPGSSVKLICRGLWDTLDWQYWQNLKGRVSHETSDSDRAIGWGLTTTYLGFSGNSLHHIFAKLTGPRVGDKIAITGSASNNIVATVAAVPRETGRVYTANTIYFEVTDDIKDSANGLGGFRNNELITITGSASNNRTHLQDTTGDNHITVAEWFSGPNPITAEAAGANVTIRQGHHITVSETFATENIGANVILTHYGKRIAQGFDMSSSWRVARVGLKIAKVGSPSDNLQIRIWGDSGGSPNTQYATGEIAPADISTSGVWKWINLDTPVTLASGSYFLVVQRAGSDDPDNYYTVAVDTAGGYGNRLLHWTGATWIAAPQGGDAAFRVWGEEDSLTLLKSLLQDTGQFFSYVSVEGTSGITINQYADGGTLASKIAENIIELGTVTGGRLGTWVESNRTARARPIPSPDALNDLRKTRDGYLNAAGEQMEPGVLFAGQWLHLEWPQRLANAFSTMSPILVEECEYHPESGAWTIKPAGAADVWSIGDIEQG